MQAPIHEAIAPTPEKICGAWVYLTISSVARGKVTSSIHDTPKRIAN
ncbi:hypothetical protein HCU40_09610 [Pseudanabaena biceps]|nr:hypothetical protein [Pseudanabaena biceps]